MKKLIFLILFLGLANVKAQFKLVPAFPNLTGFLQPTELVNSGDGTNRLFLVQQAGIIYVFHNSPTVSTKKVFINLSNKVGVNSGYSGILGLAFHPNYINNRYFYVQYSIDSTGGEFYVRLSRFKTSATNPDSALANSELILYTISARGEHFGGHIEFHDSYLYSTMGDGGFRDSAQGKYNLLGKVLRINVDSVSNGNNYSIPHTNPYFNNTSGYRQEIYALGFRNPFKFSFDNNKFILGDVGDDLFEEIDLVEIGKNYGWPHAEGFHCSPDTNNCDTSGRGYTLPIFEYGHKLDGTDYSASITGGYVYRGSAIPVLYKKYIYADWVQGKIWALDSNGANQLLFDSTMKIVSFGVDENKELYAVSFSYGLSTSKIFKLVKKPKTLKLTALIEGLYNSSSNTMPGDTVSVYLRDDDLQHRLIDSAKGYLNTSGVGNFSFFNILNNFDLRIVVRHRNSIETWGRETAFINDTLSYNFTTSASQAYGNNLILKGSKYCIYSGDVNQDGTIDLIDVGMVDNAIFNYARGYIATDINGDGFVDLADQSVVDKNAFNFVGKITP